jgi:hypothetical protein
MKYFLDTEFSERGPGYPLELISLALVAEDGREMYWINGEFDQAHANDWVAANVLPHLTAPYPMPGKVAPLDEIAADVLRFIGEDTEPEFWGYFAAYDWVVFCQLFGDMAELPRTFPYYCRDLKQFIDERGLAISQDDSDHNALSDARWIRQTYHDLTLRSAGGWVLVGDGGPELVCLPQGSIVFEVGL